MSEQPSVTVIVLNYNGKKHLEDCFASLTKIDYPADKLSLMVVDNGSSDDSVAYMQNHYPEVQLVQSPENVGFAAGNNLGAKEAAGQYVVFLNNDMWVEPNLVTGLVEAVQSDPKTVCASSKILNWDGSRFDFAGSAAHFAGYGYQVGIDEPYDPDRFTEIYPILFACGGAMMIDRRLFLDIGGFDEDYFIYYEDMDLGWRLWLLGYQVVFAANSVVYHRHHGTMDSFSDYRKQVLFKRNALYSVIKNYDDENLGKILPAIMLGAVDGVVEESVVKGHLDLSEYHIKSPKRGGKITTSIDKRNMSMLVAIHDVVENLPRLMEKRELVQKQRQRSDKEIAKMFRWPFRYWPQVSAQSQYKVIDAFNLQEIFEETARQVLVISSDILPYPGMPTVGSGLRAWGLGQGLKHCGHEVIFSMPKAALKDREAIAPAEVQKLAWEPHTLGEIVRAVNPDIVVVCNWPIMALLAGEDFGIPVILDQHGPHFIEREYQDVGSVDDNTYHKLLALRRADFFTCAGHKQKEYFHSWLEKAGWSEQEINERTAAIPFSLSPDVPERNPVSELTFVYGGVFLPWQDPVVGLSALVEWMDRNDTGALYFYGGKHPVYPVNTGIFDQLLEQLTQSSHVIAPGLVSHAELIERYTQAHIAIDLMQKNRERELAFTSRTVEYLWCGLPVIYNDYAELSDYIRQYNAGWILDPTDKEAVLATLDEIANHPEEVEKRSQNAQRLIQEKLNWNKTILPLDRFIRHPRMRSRPGHLAPRPINRTMSYLFKELQRHYKRGGISIVWKESWNFFKRQTGLS